MDDGVAHLLEVVEVAIGGDCAEGVEPELRVAYRADRNAGAVLVVQHFKQLVAYDEAVCRAEALSYPQGVVHTLFQEQPASLVSVQVLHHHVAVGVRRVLHFLRDVAG